MIYVPDLNYECYVLVNKDTIRAYEIKPYNPGYNQQVNINYRDYYINSSYLYTDGVQQFGNYSTIPICLETSKLTTDLYYRADIDKIMIVFFIFLFIAVFIISICLKSLLKGLFR